MAINVCVKHLNKKILKHSVDTTNELNFRIVCNCIHELLNIFEDSAQHIHTIVIKNCVSLIFKTLFFESRDRLLWTHKLILVLC